MYENLLGQDEVRESLIADLSSDRVPPALLFAGPPASGKLTAALETARVLSCTKGAAWNCSCPDCARHRSLVHSDLLLFGSRTYPEEIAVAKEYLARQPGRTSRIFFTRALRKLIARFAPPLWVQEESRLGKAAPLLRSLEEGIADLESLPFAGNDSSERSGRTSPPNSPAESLTALADSLAADAASLETLAPDAPGVGMVRGAEAWARLAPASARRTVILENADRLQDSARNAMLKILEEPPDTVRFILTTHRRASLMATILSRSRMYVFSARSKESTETIMRRVFGTEESVESLDAFLTSRAAYNPSTAGGHAELLLGRLLLDLGERRPSPDPEFALELMRKAEADGRSLPDILERIAKESSGFGSKDKTLAGSYVSFVRALLNRCSRILAGTEGNPAYLDLIERFSRAARDSAIQHSLLNRNPESLFQVLAASFGDT